MNEYLLRNLIREVLLTEKLKGLEGWVHGEERGSLGYEETFEDVTSDTTDAALNAEQELSSWGNAVETDPEVRDTLVKYWRNIPGEDPDRNIEIRRPWSAAFISWIQRNDPEFQGSRGHSTYMRLAKQSRDRGKHHGGFVAFQPHELPAGPDRGDLVCRPRDGSGNGWDQIGSFNHCDIYTGNNRMIGGNVNDNIDTVSYSPSRATMIIKKLNPAGSFDISESETRDIISEIISEMLDEVCEKV
jgi:hypothetical protein